MDLTTKFRRLVTCAACYSAEVRWPARLQRWLALSVRTLSAKKLTDYTACATIGFYCIYPWRLGADVVSAVLFLLGLGTASLGQWRLELVQLIHD